MNVFLLMEEIDQNDFLNYERDRACPSSRIIGVYSDKSRAEYEMKCLENTAETLQKETNSDTPSYYVEERPLL